MMWSEDKRVSEALPFMVITAIDTSRQAQSRYLHDIRQVKNKMNAEV
jgi:hypothetical protein